MLKSKTGIETETVKLPYEVGLLYLIWGGVGAGESWGDV